MLSLPDIGPDEDFGLEDFPALASLRLGHDDLRILVQQGFLSHEIRGGNAYFKLRFRRDGKQCVKYVGACQVAVMFGPLATWNVPLSCMSHGSGKAPRALKSGLKGNFWSQ